MLEIYNEQIKDLLSSDRCPQAGGLKIRQSPSSGFYVEGLKVGDRGQLHPSETGLIPITFVKLSKIDCLQICIIRGFTCNIHQAVKL